MDFLEVLQIAGTNPIRAGWVLTTQFYLWVPLVPIFLYGIYQAWMFSRWGKWVSSLDHCLLAVDVPSNNEEGPLAVESFFAQIAGAHHAITKWDRYYKGKLQSYFSFEIVSIGGNIQFLIRTERRFRDLIEASIYAQYADAEITEVEDYVDTVPETFPNDTHRLWGVEFTLSEKYCFPIKTYTDFEHSLSQEFKDPMSAFLEVMSTAKPGEQVWYQLTVTPIDHNIWREPCLEKLNEMSGKPKTKKRGVVSSLFGNAFSEPGNLLQETVRQVTGGQEIQNANSSRNVGIGEDGVPIRMYSPVDVDTMKAINRKISKIAFDVKMRLIYISKEETFQPSRVVNPLIGALKQFTELSLNSLKPTIRKTATRANYIFVKWRIAYKTRRILRAYRSRSNYRGLDPMQLNIEELATIWHFPTTFVKVPSVKTTISKKYNAPMNVPYESLDLKDFEEGALSSQNRSPEIEETLKTEDGQLRPPPDLPV